MVICGLFFCLTLSTVMTQTNSKTTCFNFVISVKFLFPVMSIVDSTERIKYKEFVIKIYSISATRQSMIKRRQCAW